MTAAKPTVLSSLADRLAKGETLLSAWCGLPDPSIAAILALANGVNAYIQEVEEDTLLVYPLQIMSYGFDMTSMIVDTQGNQADETGEGQEDAGTDDRQGDQVRESPMINRMFSRVGKNDLAALKEYLDGDGGGIHHRGNPHGNHRHPQGLLRQGIAVVAHPRSRLDSRVGDLDGAVEPLRAPGRQGVNDD